MEHKIGEIFEYNGEWYQCLYDKNNSCTYCDLYVKGRSIEICCSENKCLGNSADDKSVIFKKLKKVGEPYMAHDHSRNKDVVVQDYKLYNQHACYNGHEEMLSFGLYGRVGMVTIKSKEPIKRLNCENSVEIQIKEDMGEKKDNYDGNMDKECIQICDALNSISDVRTTESCCGHCKDRFMVFFTCDNPHSLAIIARVFDRRYIGTSQPWYIELQTKDSGAYDYFIHSETKYDSEEVMMKDINQIIENIKYWCDDKFASHFKGCDDKPTLTQFDINSAKQGKSVRTRDGRKARIICFDRNSETQPIVALVAIPRLNGIEKAITCGKNGMRFGDKEHNDDLIMLPEKKEGWINIYNADTTFYYVDGRVFETKDEAVQEAKEEVEKEQREKNEYIDTIRVEWEE